jgi:glycosyltransferase involved in cell wall biosynthesis
MTNSVTIGIPTLNRASLVTDLVKRCLSQTEPPFQIVVSDDASDDDTCERLQAFSSPFLEVIRQEKRLGMINNWNACLNKCRSDWFMLLSDDDMVTIDFVEQVKRVLQETPDVDLLIIRGRVVDKITNETNENYPPTKTTGEISFVEDILPAWLDCSFALPFASMIFRTTTLRNAGGFTHRLPYAADASAWLPIAINGRCSFYPEAKIDCIVHKGMATRTFSIDVLIDDVIKLGALVNHEVLKSGKSNQKTQSKIKKYSNIYVLNMFGHVMITNARKGVSKRHLLIAWIRYANQLPSFGICPLSIGAVLVPEKLIQIAGWPYRKWVSWMRHRLWSRINSSHTA